MKGIAVEKQYESDIEEIVSHRHDNGADLWVTPDKRLINGAPFTTLESRRYRLEIQVEKSN